RAAPAPEPSESQILLGRELGDDAAALRHVGDAETYDPLDREAGEASPFELDRARSWPHEPRDRPEQRRLAGAVRAEHGGHRAFPNRQVDAVDRADRPVLG